MTRFPQPERWRTPPLWRPRARRRLAGGAPATLEEAATVTQEGFRWRNDDGSETSATWKAAQDTDASLDIGEAARLRVVLDATGDPDPFPPTLYYRKVVAPELTITTPVPIWSGSTASASFTVSVGDLIVYGNHQQDAVGTAPTNSGTAFTWTSRVHEADTPSSGFMHARIWTAVASVGQTMTVTAPSGPTNSFSYLWVVSGQHASPIGVVGSDFQTVNGLTVNYTATAAGSVTFVVAQDYEERGTITSSDLSPSTTADLSGFTDVFVGRKLNTAAGATSFNLDPAGSSATGTVYAYIEVLPGEALWLPVPVGAGGWEMVVTDNFNSYSDGDFTGVGWTHDRAAGVGSTWQIYAPTGIIYSPHGTLHHAVTGGDNAVRVETSLKTNAGPPGSRSVGGVCFALTDGNNFLCWEIVWTEEPKTQMILSLRRSGSWTELVTTGNVMDFDPETYYDMRVEMVGFSVKGWLDDVLWLDHTLDPGDLDGLGSRAGLLDDQGFLNHTETTIYSMNSVYIAPSANITAGGQATTAQLTAPSGKTTADFSVGRMWDDENGTDTVDI